MWGGSGQARLSTTYQHVKPFKLEELHEDTMRWNHLSDFSESSEMLGKSPPVPGTP